MRQIRWHFTLAWSVIRDITKLRWQRPSADQPLLLRIQRLESLATLDKFHDLEKPRIVTLNLILVKVYSLASPSQFRDVPTKRM